MIKKSRTQIPQNSSAEILFKSDRTCCVCRDKSKPVQIHHIDENPDNHEIKNLAVLCLECHNKTQIHGGFARKLDSDQIKLYRDNWHNLIAQQRSINSKTPVVNNELISNKIDEIDKITYPENCKGFYMPFCDSEVQYRYFGLNSAMLNIDFLDEIEYCFRLLCIYKRPTDKICVSITSFVQSPETLTLFKRYADSNFLGIISCKMNLSRYFQNKMSGIELNELKKNFPYNRYFDREVQSTVNELLNKKTIAIIGKDKKNERDFANSWVKMVNESYKVPDLINDEFIDAILGRGIRFVWENVESELKKRNVNDNNRCGALDLILKCYLNQFKSNFIFPTGFNYNNTEIDNNVGSEMNYFYFPALKKRHEKYEDTIRHLTPNQFVEFVTSKNVSQLMMCDGCGSLKLNRFNDLLKKYNKKVMLDAKYLG
ncbi:MAG: HNH endonuclease signature motif containing protein [Methanoregula sp.]